MENLTRCRVHQILGHRQKRQRGHVNLPKVVDVVNAANVPGMHRQFNGGQNGFNGVGAIQGQIQHATTQFLVKALDLVR